MDPTKLLDLERRTGVKNSDIDDFVSKASEVEAAVKAMLEGKIAPEDVKIKGLESDEEKAQKEAEKKERLEKQRQKDEVLANKRKQEEKELWWNGAELFIKKNINNDIDNDDDNTNTKKDPKALILQRYTADYAKWDEWVPNDPVSAEEKMLKEQEEEKKRNEEFEKSNPDFCNQFMDDMKEREKTSKKKQDTAEVSRLKGNKSFQKKQYQEALDYYMQSLKVLPFEVKTLTNIAQVYIKLKLYDDALEFLNRSLFVDEKNVKSLSRKCFILTELGRPVEAFPLIVKALELDPKNEELIVQHRELDIITKEMKEIDEVKKLEQNNSLTFDKNIFNDMENMALNNNTDVDILKALDVDIGVKVVNELNAEIQSKVSLISASTSNSSVDTISLFKNTEMFRLCEEAMQREDKLKIYFFTSGTLENCCKLIKAVYSSNNSHMSKLVKLFKLVAESIMSRRASKMLIVEYDLPTIAKDLIQRDITTDLDAVLGSLVLLKACSIDDTCAKARAAVLDLKVVNRIGSILEQLSKNTTSMNEEVFVTSMHILRDVASIDNGKYVCDANVGFNLCAIGLALHWWYGNEKKLKDVTSTLDVTLDAMLVLSQYESLRGFFSTPLPVPSPINKAITIISILLGISSKVSSLKGSCFTILMNACVDNDNNRKNIILCGGLDHVVDILSVKESNQYLRNRSAGLLSRLCSLSECQDKIKIGKIYKVISSNLKELCSTSNIRKLETLEADEQSHYIRILASLGALNEDCARVALDLDMVITFLQFFPQPKVDYDGKISSNSVILPPEQIQSAVVLGNVARCLLAIADDERFATKIYNPQLLGIEKLICAMATCSDIRVRKNISILLAKGCRLPGVRERVSNLRGLQMMVDLNSRGEI